MSFHQLREVWLEAEEIGVDYLFMWDHFYPLSGDPDGMHFESQTLLAAAAEATNRVQLGALVCAIGYRNPNLIADMARTIDHISDGRFILGLGSGWKLEVYQEYGYDFKTAPERLRDLQAAMPVIKHRLSVLNPLPVQEHLPIMIGGGGEKVTLKIVAEHADIWNGFGTPDEIAAKCAILDQHCVTVGRDPNEIERSVLANQETLVNDADAYVAKGVTTIITRGVEPGPGMQRIRDLVAWRDSRQISPPSSKLLDSPYRVGYAARIRDGCTVLFRVAELFIVSILRFKPEPPRFPRRRRPVRPTA